MQGSQVVFTQENITPRYVSLIANMAAMWRWVNGENLGWERPFRRLHEHWRPELRQWLWGWREETEPVRQ